MLSGKRSASATRSLWYLIFLLFEIRAICLLVFSYLRELLEGPLADSSALPVVREAHDEDAGNVERPPSALGHCRRLPEPKQQLRQ